MEYLVAFVISLILAGAVIRTAINTGDTAKATIKMLRIMEAQQQQSVE